MVLTTAVNSVYAQDYPVYYLYHKSGKIERILLVSLDDSCLQAKVEGVSFRYPLSQVDSITRHVPKFARKVTTEVVRNNPFLDSFSKLGFYFGLSRGSLLTHAENFITYGFSYQKPRNMHNTVGLSIDMILFGRKDALLVPICLETRYYPMSPNPRQPLVWGFKMGYVFNLYSSQAAYDGGPTATVFGGRAFLLGGKNYLTAFLGMKAIVAGNELYDNYPANEKLRMASITPELHLEYRF